METHSTIDDEHDSFVDRDSPLHTENDGVHYDDADIETLEQRIRRLENAVVALSDTSLMESRLLERIRTEIEPHTRAITTQGVLMDGTRALPPAPKAEPVHIDPQSIASHLRKAMRPSSWLVFEILADIKDTFSMYFDSRYRKTVTFSMLLPMLLGMFIVSQFLLSSFIGKFIDIGIALIAYKVLMREVQRYRELIGPLDQHS